MKATLAQRGLGDVVLVRDELGEQLCVGTRLSCPFLSVCALLLGSARFCCLALPHLCQELCHTFCCQLDSEPRDVTAVTSSQEGKCEIWV